MQTCLNDIKTSIFTEETLPTSSFSANAQTLHTSKQSTFSEALIIAFLSCFTAYYQRYVKNNIRPTWPHHHRLCTGKKLRTLAKHWFNVQTKRAERLHVLCAAHRLVILCLLLYIAIAKERKKICLTDPKNSACLYQEIGTCPVCKYFVQIVSQIEQEVYTT